MFYRPNNINTVRLSPQNLLHSSSFCEFIDELIEITSISIERIFYFLYLHSADTSSDFRGIRIHRWRFSEKSFQSCDCIDLFLHPFFIISSEPENYLIDLIFCASLFLCLCDIHRIDACKGHFVNTFESSWVGLHMGCARVKDIFLQLFCNTSSINVILLPQVLQNPHSHNCSKKIKNQIEHRIFIPSHSIFLQTYGDQEFHDFIQTTDSHRDQNGNKCEEKGISGYIEAKRKHMICHHCDEHIEVKMHDLIVFQDIKIPS